VIVRPYPETGSNIQMVLSGPSNRPRVPLLQQTSKEFAREEKRDVLTPVNALQTRQCVLDQLRSAEARDSARLHGSSMIRYKVLQALIASSSQERRSSEVREPSQQAATNHCKKVVK